MVTIENRRGALAEVARILADAGVNVTGLSLGRHPDEHNLRFLVDRPELAQRALERRGYKVTGKEVASLRIANRPGALAKATDRLAKRGVNIEAILVSVKAAKQVELVFQVDDLNSAKRVIKEIEEE